MAPGVAGRSVPSHLTEQEVARGMLPAQSCVIIVIKSTSRMITHHHHHYHRHQSSPSSSIIAIIITIIITTNIIVVAHQPRQKTLEYVRCVQSTERCGHEVVAKLAEVGVQEYAWNQPRRRRRSETALMLARDVANRCWDDIRGCVRR